MDIEEELHEAVLRLRKYDGILSTEDSLLLYGLYNRIHIGECCTPEPWHSQTSEHARWKAWFDQNALKRSEAIKMYIQKVYSLVR